MERRVIRREGFSEGVVREMVCDACGNVCVELDDDGEVLE